MARAPSVNGMVTLAGRFPIQLANQIKAAAETSGYSVAEWLRAASTYALAQPTLTEAAQTLARNSAPIRNPRRSEPGAADCKHPPTRRIGSTCMVCGKDVKS